MTTLDDRLRPRAQDLIARYGKLVLLQSLSQGDYDPATGAAAADTLTYEVKGVVQQPSRQMYDLQLAKQGDVALLIADEGLPEGVKPPKAGDTVDFQDGEPAWTVTGVQTLYTGDLPAVHTLVLRR